MELDPAKALKIFDSLRTKHDVATALGVTFNKHLVYYLYRLSPQLRYTRFEIKKKNGATRTISTPVHGLKAVQTRLSDLLYGVYQSRPGVHGYVQARGPTTNAEAHIRQRYVLNLDLEDFFGSINFGRVRGMFLAPPYSRSAEVATLLAQICCHEDKLPQGAPTSPVISNMICSRMDSQLKRLAREANCYYTRYSDDLTFSTNAFQFPEGLAYGSGIGEGRRIEIGDRLSEIIDNNGFAVNACKTRLLTPSDRQEVTGLVVNRFVNVDRRYIRALRGALHGWRRFGFDKAQELFAKKYHWRSRPHKHQPNLARVLFGRIQYVGSIRGWDDSLYKIFATSSMSSAPLRFAFHRTHGT